MSGYSIKKIKVSRSGMCSLGWFLGYGYVIEQKTVKSDKWCVVTPAGKVFAECRSKSGADKIAAALNKVKT